MAQQGVVADPMPLARLSQLQLLQAVDLRPPQPLDPLAGLIQRDGIALAGQQLAGGHQAVAQGHVDPLGADRTHRVGGIPQQQQPRHVPAAGLPHLHAEPLRAAQLIRLAPQQGGHTDEILRGLGYGDERIAALRAQCIV